MSTKDKIIEELQPMFADARTHGLWFGATGHVGAVFTPDELQEYQEKGYYLWGKKNWRLIDPNEYLEQLKKQRDNIDRKIQNVESKLSNPQKD